VIKLALVLLIAMAGLLQLLSFALALLLLSTIFLAAFLQRLT